MRAFLDLLLPTSCVGCAQPGGIACQSCRQLLAAQPRVRWPSPVPRGLPPPVCVAAYDAPVRAMLLAYKERGATELRKPLATAIALSVQAVVDGAAAGAVVLVPVPSTSAARRARGCDVVLDLAKCAARVVRATGCRAWVVTALRHSRAVADSAGLSSEQRAANLAGALVARPGAATLLRRAPVVLVDDLVTTGVTLAEAARALRDAGVTPLAAATVASTERHAGR